MSLSAEQQRLVLRNLDLAHSLAWAQFRRSSGYGLEVDEFIAVAYQGLVVAVTKWSPLVDVDDSYDSDLHFTGYAQVGIQTTLTDWLRSFDHVSRQVRRDYKDLTKNGYGEGRSADELASLTGMPVERIQAIIKAVEITTTSVEAEREAYGYEEPPSMTAQDDVEDSVVVSAAQGLVAEVFQTLSPVQRSVLALRYYRGYEFRQIAIELGVSSGVVRSAHHEAIDLIYAALRMELVSGKDG